MASRLYNCEESKVERDRVKTMKKKPTEPTAAYPTTAYPTAAYPTAAYPTAAYPTAAYPTERLESLHLLTVLSAHPLAIYGSSIGHLRIGYVSVTRQLRPLAGSPMRPLVM